MTLKAKSLVTSCHQLALEMSLPYVYLAYMLISVAFFFGFVSICVCSNLSLSLLFPRIQPKILILTVLPLFSQPGFPPFSLWLFENFFYSQFRSNTSLLFSLPLKKDLICVEWMYKQYPFNIIAVILNHHHEHNPSYLPLNQSWPTPPSFLTIPLQSYPPAVLTNPLRSWPHPCSLDHAPVLLFSCSFPLITSRHLTLLLPSFSRTDWLYGPVLVLISRFCFHTGLCALTMSPVIASLPQAQPALIKTFPKSDVSFQDLTQVKDLGL